MSDDNGGPALEPMAAGGDQANGDPMGGGTLDGVHRTLSTLGMRIDALVTSTSSYRSAITDRLTEYADLVTKLTRAQATDLEEYRHATERTMGELRRGLSTSEETLERVAARIDAMLNDADSTDDQSRRMLAEVRSILDGQESLGRFLTESLDRFGEQVTDRLTVSEAASRNQFEAVQATLGSLQLDGGSVDAIGAAVDERLAPMAKSLDQLAPMATSLDRLGQVPDLLLDVASGEVVAALWDEVHGLRDAVETGAPAELRHEVTDLATAVRALLASAEVVDAEPAELVDAGPAELVDVEPEEDRTDLVLDELLAEMVRLREDLTEGLVIDTEGIVQPAMIEEVRREIAMVGGRVQEIADIQAKAVAARAAVDEGTIGDRAPDRALDQIQASLDELIQRANAAADHAALSGFGPPGADGTGSSVDLSPLAEMIEQLRGDLAELPHRVEASMPAPVAPAAPAPAYATIDPDTVDLLRAEIRAGSSAPAELVDSLRAELVALRRRIKLRVEGEVLSDDQLALIAEAVAERLGR